jgi:hypothetical protein
MSISSIELKSSELGPRARAPPPKPMKTTGTKQRSFPSQYAVTAPYLTQTRRYQYIISVTYRFPGSLRRTLLTHNIDSHSVLATDMSLTPRQGPTTTRRSTIPTGQETVLGSANQPTNQPTNLITQHAPKLPGSDVHNFMCSGGPGGGGDRRRDQCVAVVSSMDRRTGTSGQSVTHFIKMRFIAS